ncbi:MAG TPA: hypothetical protein VNZ22_10505 [Bacillota bacterium]|nr:hypothetical protein [Bacillota bacterium]
MRSYKRRAVLGLVLLLAALPVLIWTFHHRAVARFQEQLLATGERLKIEELLPPWTPPEQNGALLFRQTMGSWGPGVANLLEKNPPVAMQLVAPGKAMVGWAQPDVRSATTNTWSEVEAVLAPYQETLALVRAAAERPIFDFQLDYRQGFGLVLPHLAPLKRTEQRLATATLCELHQGEMAAASTNVQVMLALVKATAHERLAISQLVRIAMAHICLAATWELLQSPNLTGDQLAALQRDWTELKFLQPAEESLTLERAFGLMMLDRMRNSGRQCRQVMSSLGSRGPVTFGYSFGQSADTALREIVLGTKEAHWRWFLSYPDQLRTLQGYQVVLESFRSVRGGQPFAVARSRQQARLAEMRLQSTNEEFGLHFDASGPELRSLFSQAVVSLGGLLNRVFGAEAARELTITAVALKRYQLRYGQYPGELSALVPEFLMALPRDPADGQPLRYHLKPDATFLLYSVGEDGLDDGGDASQTDKSEGVRWQKGRDLVWPQPATPEEVRTYQRNKGLKHGR